MSQQKLLYNIMSTKLFGVYCYRSSGRNTETNMFEQKFKWGRLTVLHTAQSTWVLFSTTRHYKQHQPHSINANNAKAVTAKTKASMFTTLHNQNRDHSTKARKLHTSSTINFSETLGSRTCIHAAMHIDIQHTTHLR